MLHGDVSYHALTNLTRLARRRQRALHWLEQALAGPRLQQCAELALEVAVETGDPIGRVLAEQLREHRVPVLAARLLERCDREDARFSVPLTEVAVVAAEIRIDERRTQPPPLPPCRRAELARWMANLCGRLCRLGRDADALEVARGAVELAEVVVREDPRYAPDLALALNNQGSTYWRPVPGAWGASTRPSRRVERRSKALDAAREAVDRLRPLVEERPAVAFDLVLALRRHGRVHMAFGQPPAALRCFAEAIEVCAHWVEKSRPPLLGPVPLQLDAHLVELGELPGASEAREKLCELRTHVENSES
ncbi:MAG: hypothetical protein GY842_29020 [bacterium]|nr:hypothetical protein [bacterium]